VALTDIGTINQSRHIPGKFQVANLIGFNPQWLA
jgi:hypothetical protein